VLIGHHVTAGGERRRHSRLGLIVRNRDVDVHAVALWAWRVHLLEPEGGALAARVHQVLGPFVTVAEDRAPERLHLGRDEGVDGDLHRLNGRWICRYAQATRRRGDLPGQLDVMLAQPADVVRRQAHGHARVPQVDIGVMVGRVGQPADRADKRDAGRERPGPEAGAGPGEDHPPVLDPGRRVELSCRDPLSHEGLV
jgi:hypothetical protein